MSVLTRRQAAAALERQGMPPRHVAEFVAIAEAESSLNDQAQSPVGALGLWQIMPFNFAPLGLDIAFWANPDTNARAAVLLSGHGSNCAAWDTCYADIQASGRLAFLGWPQRGSAAWNNLSGAAVAIGHDKLGFAAGPQPASVGTDVAPAIHQIQVILHKRLPVLRRLLIAERMAVSRQFTPGWRP